MDLISIKKLKLQFFLQKKWKINSGMDTEGIPIQTKGQEVLAMSNFQSLDSANLREIIQGPKRGSETFHNSFWDKQDMMTTLEMTPRKKPQYSGRSRCLI